MKTMITMTRTWLINWYGFENSIDRVGLMTDITGNNGSGKSAWLDAIKYAYIGDTGFNSSSDAKGTGSKKRTIDSYVRKLINASRNEYGRPVSQYNEVYAYIMLEWYDDLNDQYLITGCIIKDDAANTTETRWFNIENMSLDDIHPLSEDNIPYTFQQFRKVNDISYAPNKDEAFNEAMSLLGLKISTYNEGRKNYLRKLKSILTYDPKEVGKISDFIKNYVLDDEKKVDISKLKKTKEDIDELNRTLTRLDEEISFIKKIIDQYDQYHHYDHILLLDEIKNAYKRVVEAKNTIEDINNQIEENKEKRAICEKENESLNDEILLLAQEIEGLDETLDEWDVTKSLHHYKDRESQLEEKRRQLQFKKRDLEELMGQLSYIEKKINTFSEENHLDALDHKIISQIKTKKKEAIFNLRRIVEECASINNAKIPLLEQKKRSVHTQSVEEKDIIEALSKNKFVYHEAKENLALIKDIKDVFKKKNIDSPVEMVCKYVTEIDEEWRAVIENYLGWRRYDIIVDPSYLDIAQQVRNKGNYPHARLVNTYQLKDFECVEQSLMEKLSVSNIHAARYLKFLLGKIVAIEDDNVKEYPRGMKKDGTASLNMTIFSLDLHHVNDYVFGESALSLNIEKHEKHLNELMARLSSLEKNQHYAQDFKNDFQAMLSILHDQYDFDIDLHIEENNEALLACQSHVEELTRQMHENIDFENIRHQRELALEKKKNNEQKVANNRYEMDNIDRQIKKLKSVLDTRKKEVEEAKLALEDAREKNEITANEAINQYEDYLSSHKEGNVLPESKAKSLHKKREQLVAGIMGLQGEFGGKYYSEATIVNTLEAEKMFRHRYNDIQMGNIEMIKTDLIEKKSHYRENFKNEFALKILKFCNDAMMELKRLNKELSETGYDTQYVFDVHFKDDSSDYASIIRFGKTLSEGLLTFTSGNVNIEELDQEMDQIVDDIINSDDIDDYADYRNYLSYDILFSNDTIKQGSLSKQIGSNSGAELQIPYTLILISALLMIYNHRDNSSRILFIDEPFEKLSPDNVMKMVRFFKEKKLQCFFCSASNLGDIGQEADVILQAIKYGKDNSMKLLPYHFK